MASALPIVATRVGEVPHLIEDGVSGLLVPAEAVEPLAAAIESLLRDPDQRTALGRAARKRILENYSAEQMSEDYLRLYKDVTAHASTVSQGAP